MLKFADQILFARMIKRYKRFFIDAVDDEGNTITAHNPNTGSMKGLLNPNSRLLLTKNSDPKRKTKFTVQAIENNEKFVGINTHLPNKLIEKSLDHPLLSEFKNYQSVRREVVYGQENRSRVDFVLSDNSQGKSPLYLEIKNVTLKEKNAALFPDAVSTRALKHIEDLLWIKKKGFLAQILFIVQRQDCSFFSPAHEIDPKYAAALTQARAQGLKVRALAAKISQDGLWLTHEMPCIFWC